MVCDGLVYNNLVLEGGGVKTYAYIGAFKALEEHGVLQKINAVAGSSAGAIYACLLAIGLDCDEISNFMLEIDLKAELEGNDPPEVLIENFRSNYGLHFSESKSMRSIIGTETGDPDITFKQLHAIKEQLHGKDLYITGVDVVDHTKHIFSYKHTPDMKLIDAVRISCAFPFMYAPIVQDGHVYVDGGILDNYPVSIFESSQVQSCDTLGLNLSSHDHGDSFSFDELDYLFKNILNKFPDIKEDLINVKFEDVNSNGHINSIGSYANHVFNTYSSAICDDNNYEIDEIQIDNNGFVALDIDIEYDQIQDLINNGYSAANNFINDVQQNYSWYYVTT